MKSGPNFPIIPDLLFHGQQPFFSFPSFLPLSGSSNPGGHVFTQPISVWLHTAIKSDEYENQDPQNQGYLELISPEEYLKREKITSELLNLIRKVGLHCFIQIMLVLDTESPDLQEKTVLIKSYQTMCIEKGLAKATELAQQEPHNTNFILTMVINRFTRLSKHKPLQEIDLFDSILNLSTVEKNTASNSTPISIDLTNKDLQTVTTKRPRPASAYQLSPSKKSKAEVSNDPSSLLDPSSIEKETTSNLSNSHLLKENLKPKTKRPSVSQDKYPLCTASDYKVLEKIANFKYLPHSLDKPKFVFVAPVFILNGGLGLFAAKNIEKGFILGVYTGKEIKPDQKIKSMRYVMNLEDRKIDSRKKGNLTRFCNHSPHDFNAEYVLENSYIVLKTTRSIKANEQILVNYNKNNENESGFCFISPNDSWLSAKAVVAANKKQYEIKKIQSDCPALKMKAQDSMVTTCIGSTILRNKPLKPNSLKPQNLSLCFFKTENASLNPLEFGEHETFNGLMLASYFGQTENVRLLLNNGANPNTQQHISGYTALMYAVKGYKDDKSKRNTACSTILALLNNVNKANPFIQNKKNQLFIFLVIKYFNEAEIKKIFNCLENNGVYFKKLLKFLDHREEDICCYAFKYKKLELLNEWLDRHPEFKNGIGHNRKVHFYTPKKLRKLIHSYTAAEKDRLKEIFQKNKISETIIEEIFTSQSFSTSSESSASGSDVLDKRETEIKISPTKRKR